MYSTLHAEHSTGACINAHKICLDANEVNITTMMIQLPAYNQSYSTTQYLVC